MNREIKFRAWDIKLQIIFNNRETMQSMLWVWSWKAHNLFKNENVMIMQYTWLKDKEWVEIYEWDIVECRHWIDKINFINWCFVWSSKWKSEELIDIIYECEVIWNIYENKELLTNLK